MSNSMTYENSWLSR